MVFNMVKVSFLDILDYISHKPECYVFLCPVQVPLKGLPAGGNEIKLADSELAKVFVAQNGNSAKLFERW